MAEEEDLYDEFGNYIGPELDDSDESEAEEDDHSADDLDLPDTPKAAEKNLPQPAAGDYDTIAHHGSQSIVIADDYGSEPPQNAIILHEDKEHYPSAEEVYGSDVRAVVLDEDAMDLDTPIVEPMKQTDHTAAAKDGDPTDFKYLDDYLAVQLSNETTMTRRGVAIIGHFHHGKTTLIDLLLEPTLASSKKRFGAWGPKASLDSSVGGGPRYTDIMQTEQDRRMSLISTPITTLLPDSRGKSYCITMVDCPGHPQFHDETCAALAGMDGAVLVVDVVEGVQLHTEMTLRQAISEGLKCTLVISKMDRLIVELKLPPNDAYFKILNLIESLNQFILKYNSRFPIFSPASGNVAFSSGVHGWLFTLKSFCAQVLANHRELGIGQDDLVPRLWGDSFLDPSTRQFFKSARRCQSLDGKPVKRTFVTLILEPIYKIYSACLGDLEIDLNPVLRSVGVFLTKEELRSSARPLLRAALSQFIPPGGFVDMVVQHSPNPMAAAAGKLARCFSGPLSDSVNDTVLRAMKECDPNGPTVIHCVKNYPSADGRSFWTFGRIYSGTVRPAETVHVLGEAFSPEDEEDASTATVAAVAIPRGRKKLQVSLLKAGNWVLLQGVDATISKTATLVSEREGMHIFKPLQFSQAGGESVVKLAIEPLNPSDLPKMVDGLRSVSKAYPMAATKVEESGEHVVLGTGELYMDCMLHDLRHVYSEIEVKVADPIAAFRETVVETSSLKCFAETANQRNRLTFIAEPMDDGLAEQLEAGKVKIDWDKKKLGRFFQTKYGWDLLSSRSVWAFGDSPTHGTNILMDDTLPGEVDKTLLNSCRSSIVQGFQWATREGPLCEEPVRSTKLKILDVSLADKSIYRGGGQIIPTTRRTIHSALLTATPRLLEPVYRVEIMCPGNIVESISPVLMRRRGHIVQDRPISGSSFCCVKGYLPVLDSFGFETDLRTFTQGQAMVYSTFDHWQVVPGDPLDRNIILHPLEPSPPAHLARELLLKTRRRKGLSDISESKFFDDAMKSYLYQQEEMNNVTQ